MDKAKQFGRRLRTLREDLHMTQEQLREEMLRRSGVTVGQNYISDIERKGQLPTLGIAAAMAEALDVSLDYLAGLTDDARPRHAIEPHFTTPEADEVGQIVDMLSIEARQTALMMVRQLAENEEAARQQWREQTQRLLRFIERVAGPDARRRAERELIGAIPGEYLPDITVE